MRTFLFFTNLALILGLLESSASSASLPRTQNVQAARSAEIESSPPALAVTLKAANDATILFNAQSKEEVTSPDRSGLEIPHLVLNRNGVPTPGFERTLIVTLENLSVPQSGMYARLSIETQHSNPDLGRERKARIQVWEDTRFIPYQGDTEAMRSLTFTVVFPSSVKRGPRTIRTPTDYFSYQLTLFDRSGNILQESQQEFAFLLENQWRVPLPRVLEATPGAAPNELIIYYYDMLPFQGDLRDPETRIPRKDVGRYIQIELMPAMIDAFVMQSNLWELPWYAEWSNSRTDEDPKALSVALVGSGIWYHGTPPSLGHAMISIRVDGSFGEYSNLTDGIMSVFHHELFHNQQRNISLHFGGQGKLHGKDQAWKLFSEGTAVMASAVGQPAVQFAASLKPRSYLRRAGDLIGSDGKLSGSLNKSYQQMPYHTAIYWRFLYENCGGINDGAEDPSSGMKVIRSVLETLYSGKIVNINSSTETAQALPRIVDSALQATPSCKFRTYEESLVHFARAIYMLRLENGHCPGSDSSSCGFHDPRHVYPDPPAQSHPLTTGATKWIHGSIESSFGLDLLELEIDPSAAGKSLRIYFRNFSDPEHEFNVEVWKIKTLDSSTGAETRQGELSEAIWRPTENDFLTLELDSLQLNEFDRLGLIITRTDPYERSETPGKYSLHMLVK